MCATDICLHWHGQEPLIPQEAIVSELRHHPFLPKLATLADEIRALRKYARYAKKSDNLTSLITVPVGLLMYLDEAADVLEEQLPKESAADQDLPRYGLYL